MINSSAFISGAQYLQDGFLGPITVASNNQYNYSALYQDTTLILQLATLNLNPPYGNELAKLSNATSLNTGEPLSSRSVHVTLSFYYRRGDNAIRGTDLDRYHFCESTVPHACRNAKIRSRLDLPNRPHQKGSKPQ